MSDLFLGIIYFFYFFLGGGGEGGGRGKYAIHV